MAQEEIQKLVLLRHGESIYNLENRFTGWTDVDLSANGLQQAIEAGKLLAEKGYTFDIGFTSVLKRSIKTMHFALEQMDNLWIPVHKSWRLNERFYGALQGLNKDETVANMEKSRYINGVAFRMSTRLLLPSRMNAFPAITCATVT